VKFIPFFWKSHIAETQYSIHRKYYKFQLELAGKFHFRGKKNKKEKFMG